MLPAPAKSQGNRSSPTGRKLSMPCHKSTLLCLRTAQPQRLRLQSSKHNSCKLLDDHQGSETGRNGLGTAHRAKRRPSKYRSNHLSPSQQQTSEEFVLQAHHARQKQYPKASGRVIQFCTYNWYSSTHTLDGSRHCTKEKNGG